MSKTRAWSRPESRWPMGINRCRGDTTGHRLFARKKLVYTLQSQRVVVWRHRYILKNHTSCSIRHFPCVTDYNTEMLWRFNDGGEQNLVFIVCFVKGWRKSQQGVRRKAWNEGRFHHNQLCFFYTYIWMLLVLLSMLLFTIPDSKGTNEYGPDLAKHFGFLFWYLFLINSIGTTLLNVIINILVLSLTNLYVFKDL